MGDAEAERLVTALAEDAPVSVRLNPLRNVVPAGAAQPVPWSSAGYYLAGRPAFTFDPLLHAGAYYVQEAASMFVEQALRAMDGVPRRVLDLYLRAWECGVKTIYYVRSKSLEVEECESCAS